MPFRRCSVDKCLNDEKNRELSFYSIPAIRRNAFNPVLIELLKRRRAAWLKVLNPEKVEKRKDSLLCVCSSHFVSGGPADVWDVSKIDWVPTLSVPLEGEEKDSPDTSDDDDGQHSSTVEIIAASEFVSVLDSERLVKDVPSSTHSDTNSKVQTGSSEPDGIIVGLREKIEELERKNSRLEQLLSAANDKARKLEAQLEISTTTIQHLKAQLDERDTSRCKRLKQP